MKPTCMQFCYNTVGNVSPPPQRAWHSSMGHRWSPPWAAKRWREPAPSHARLTLWRPWPLKCWRAPPKPLIPVSTVPLFGCSSFSESCWHWVVEVFRHRSGEKGRRRKPSDCSACNTATASSRLCALDPWNNHLLQTHWPWTLSDLPQITQIWLPSNYVLS